MNTNTLSELPLDSLDTILGMPIDNKLNYFSKLVLANYPKVEPGTEEFTDLLEYYVSSYYVEKLYRSNRFFNENFIPIYTKSGLIRNIIGNPYYAHDDLIIH